MSSNSWLEIYICRVMPRIWEAQTCRSSSCQRHFEAHDNVGFPIFLCLFSDTILLTSFGICEELVVSFHCFPGGRYPSLRVAYIDEVEETGKDKSKKMVEKVYYSTLVKVAPPTKPIDSSEPIQNLDQVPVLVCFTACSDFIIFRNLI